MPQLKKNIILPPSDAAEISLRFYENSEDNLKCRVNFTQNVFSFLIAGQKEIFNSQNPSALTGQEFALITTPNCLMTEKRSSPEIQYQSVLLFFSNQILEDFSLKYAHLLQKSPNQPYHEIEIFKYDPYCTHFRTSLLLLIQEKENDNQGLLQAKFNEIMLYLLRHEPEKMTAILSKPQNNQELKFRRTIENNLFSHLDLEELAFLSNMSLSTFKRHFRKYYQTSPRQYFLQKRMEFARYMIGKGERPKDVYQKTGYQTLSNFIKAYKAHFGATPGPNASI